MSSSARAKRLGDLAPQLRAIDPATSDSARLRAVLQRTDWHPVRVNSRMFDPILGDARYHRVFAALETMARGGPTLAALGVDFHLAPDVRLASPAELARAVGDDTYAVLLLEHVAYVVRRAQIPPALARDIPDDASDPLLRRVRPVRVDPTLPVVPPSVDTTLPLPPRWSDDPGPLDLTDFLAATRAYWHEGLAAEHLAPFAPLPTLHAWLEARRAGLHPMDLVRLRQLLGQLMTAPNRQGCVTSGQQLAWRDQLLGHLAEIVQRAAVLDDFAAVRDEDPRMLVLVEPQLTTGDTRHSADALIGWLDATTRTLHVVALYEQSTGPGGESRSAAQHRANLERRFAATGARLTHAVGEWAQVAVDVTQATPESWSLPEAVAGDLRATADAIWREASAWSGLQQGVAGTVSTEMLRYLRAGATGATVAGVVAKHVLDTTWAAWDRRAAQSGLREVVWVREQWRVHAAVAPAPVAAFLRIYVQLLDHLAQELHPDALLRGWSMEIDGENDVKIATIRAALQDRAIPYWPAKKAVAIDEARFLATARTVATTLTTARSRQAFADAVWAAYCEGLEPAACPSQSAFRQRLAKTTETSPLGLILAATPLVERRALVAIDEARFLATARTVAASLTTARSRRAFADAVWAAYCEGLE
ncbi:MAG: hypothetical protein HY696_06300, partial [Deltaproteobacteria bacterium]|nr:hypothetical protein [Deltaproteobacteria bacterium]